MEMIVFTSYKEVSCRSVTRCKLQSPGVKILSATSTTLISTPFTFHLSTCRSLPSLALNVSSGLKS